MNRKTKKVLNSVLILLAMSEHSNEKEINVITTLINVLIAGNGKISQEGYQLLTEALEPLIIKEEEEE